MAQIISLESVAMKIKIQNVSLRCECSRLVLLLTAQSEAMEKDGCESGQKNHELLLGQLRTLEKVMP